ncbi:hypothetical protein CBR_g22324 [Chara braunii]|uniref:Glycosyltransferase 61 catalytic domain-containing protein n=1 Tax=Chara braunii TaxID=69332 RepID=A0A388JUT8_CHABU|nr:hypothetical protein CBR_g22324 [Chara braunii]|eukprot:GBG61527.1 hypothetical protein CBR_g22324 [Chara braunii]
MKGAEEPVAGSQTHCNARAFHHLRANHAGSGGGSWMRKSFGMLSCTAILALLVLNALMLPWPAYIGCEGVGSNPLSATGAIPGDWTSFQLRTYFPDCGSLAHRKQKLNAWQGSNPNQISKSSQDDSASFHDFLSGQEGEPQGQQDDDIDEMKSRDSQEDSQPSPPADSSLPIQQGWQHEEEEKATGYEIYHDRVCTSGVNPVCFPRVRGLCFSRKRVTLCQGGSRAAGFSDEASGNEGGQHVIEHIAGAVQRKETHKPSSGYRGADSNGSRKVVSSIKSAGPSQKPPLVNRHPSVPSIAPPTFMRFDGERLKVPVVKGECPRSVGSSPVSRQSWISLAETQARHGVNRTTLSDDGGNSEGSYVVPDGQLSRKDPNGWKGKPLHLSSASKSAQWVGGLSLVADERFMPYKRPNPHHEAEKLIPAILLVQKYGLRDSSLYWFASYDTLSPWAKGLLSALDFEASVTFLPLPGDNDSPVCFEDAILFSLPTNVTYVPDVSTNEWLRSRVLKHCGIPNVVSRGSIKQAVVLDRSSGTRRFGNKQAILEVLESELHVPAVHRLSGIGDFCQQVATVASEDFVVTPHGSHNVNFLFARPYATVIEVFPYLYHTHVFGNFIHAARLHHYEILGLLPKHSPMMWLYSLLGWDACFNRVRWCKNYARQRSVYADTAAMRRVLRSIISNQRKKDDSFRSSINP